MFRAGLLLIIKRIDSVETTVGIVMRYVDWLLAGSGWIFLLFETQIQNIRGLIMQYGSGTNLLPRNGTIETAHCSNIHK